MASPAASLLPTMKLEDVVHEDSVLVQGQLTESVASPSSAFVSQVRTAAAALFLTMGDGKGVCIFKYLAAVHPSWDGSNQHACRLICPATITGLPRHQFDPQLRIPH